MKLFTTLLLILIYNVGQTQDTTNVSLDLSYEVKGKHLLNTRGAKTINTNQVISDNPFNHFAIYGGFTLKPSYKNKYSVDLGVFFEERNHSGGNNTLAHLVFYPRITFRLKDTIRLNIAGIKIPEIKAIVTAGDLWDENFNDILRIYNLDFQGFIAKIGYKNIWFSYFKVSDLSYNVGLGLNEMNKFELSYKYQKGSLGFSYTKNWTNSTPKKDNNIGIYSSYSFNDKSSIITQFDRRLNNGLGVGNSVGLKYKLKIKNQNLSIKYQYYDGIFNQDYATFDRVNYTTSFNNFTGTQLYPLKNYYRPVNQWALLTSFQRSNIHNLEVLYSLKKSIFKSMYFIGVVDVNILHSSLTEEWVVFPAYDLGLGINFRNVFSFEFTCTNKHMDLKNFYQGHHLSKLPYTSISLKMKN